jgi:hypothetical protein
MLPKNLTAAQRFVDFAMLGQFPSIGMLARCVDELALSYCDTPTGEPDESEDAPPREYETQPNDISSRFPSLGYYGTTFGIELPGEAVVGDAIDDIMDITNDLTVC